MATQQSSNSLAEDSRRSAETLADGSKGISKGNTVMTMNVTVLPEEDTATRTNLAGWLPVLGKNLEIVEFAEKADFFPFAGKSWGVLADAKKKILYPFAGQIVFFEETDESHEAFDRFRQELSTNPNIASIGNLVGSMGNKVHHCHTGKDGLFSEKQVAEYDEYVTNKPFWQALANNTISKWKKSWGSENKLFLDLGCGTGRCMKQIMEEGHRVIGLDLSYAMLRSIEAQNLLDPERYLLVLASATRVPLADSTIDAVTCFGTLHHVSSPEQAMAEVSRVLKRGGVFQALETNNSPFRALFDLVMRLVPLWEEEAGEHQIISAKKMTDWTKKLPITWDFDYSIYFLPHILYPLKNVDTVTTIVKYLNFPAKIPFLRKAGGILLMEARRQG